MRQVSATRVSCVRRGTLERSIPPYWRRISSPKDNESTAMKPRVYPGEFANEVANETALSEYVSVPDGVSSSGLFIRHGQLRDHFHASCQTVERGGLLYHRA